MYKKTILSVILILTSSVAFAQKVYEMGNPNDETNYGYLKAYAPLKDRLLCRISE